MRCNTRCVGSYLSNDDDIKAVRLYLRSFPRFFRSRSFKERESHLPIKRFDHKVDDVSVFISFCFENLSLSLFLSLFLNHLINSSDDKVRRDNFSSFESVRHIDIDPSRLTFNH
jgi:hypothetical protein